MSDTLEVNTLVFRGEFDKGKNPLVEPHCGLSSSAWSRGNMIEEAGELRDRVEELEDFLQWAMEEGATELDFKLALEGVARKKPTPPTETRVVGMSWLAAAYERIVGGEQEIDVLADYGYARKT